MNRLLDKVFGCLAASNIGSAMGAAVEGWSKEAIAERHGLLEELLPYSHYGGRERPPGTTEDGIERQRLMCTAIIEKGDRISAGDLARVWVRDIDPANFSVQMEPCDEILYELAAAGMPAGDIGRYSNWIGIVSFARSCHPIGLINAADPEQAALDACDVGRLYQPLHGYGLDWAAAVTSAIAEGLRPEPTVDSVIEAATVYVAEPVRREIMRGVELAEECGDWQALRDAFDERYRNTSGSYAMSMAYEIVTKGLAILKAVAGDAREAIIAGVNFGRDTDCTAAVAGGIAGAYAGSSSLPAEWIEQVDEATRQNEHTVSQRTLMETAEGIYAALEKRCARLAGQVEELRGQMG